MNQKGLTNIVLIIALVVTVVGVGAYFMMTKEPKITFVFLDEKINYPITNKTVTIQERWLCKEGGSCNPPTLFKGSTNNSGQLSVGSDLFTKDFNIIIDEYFVIGPFQECDNGADTVCYPNPKKVASDSFDPNKDSIVTVIARAQN